MQCESLYKFQFESLNLWQLGIVELILTKELDRYTFAQVNAKYREIYEKVTGKETNSKRVMDLADAKDFLQSYKHWGDKEPMGHFEDTNKGPELVVKEKYKSGNAGYREVTLDDL